MEEDFFATVKFKSGEEIFSKVMPSYEDNKTLLLLSNPIKISEARHGRSSGYKVEPWLKTSSEDLFAIDFSDVLTISESNDVEMIYIYQSYVRQKANKGLKRKNMNTKEMGYISTVGDAKEILEKIYKNSKDHSNDL